MITHSCLPVRRSYPAAMLALIAAALLSLVTPVLAEQEKRPRRTPNVVLILADDLGYGDLPAYGRQDLKTPAIDRLAREGVRFTQCYANGPECTPTRAALLTGRYQQRIGGLECAIGTGNVGRYDDAIRLRAMGELGLPASETSLAQLLKKAGYVTAISGKWHLGYDNKFSPNRHGFDEAFYCLGGGMDYYYHVETTGEHVLRQNERPVRRDGRYFTDLVTEEAESFILRQRARPFFLYVAYTAPHAPYQGPNERPTQPLPADSPLQNQAKAPPAVYRAMIERMDEGIGKLLERLDETKLANRTIVLFVSDNGGTPSARNAPLSGFKSSTLEGGIRVPAVVRWPGVLPAGRTSNQACITFDFTRSILAAAGAAVPPERRLDGIDVLGHLASGKPDLPRTLFWRGRRGDRTVWGVHDGSLKYVRRMQGGQTEEHLFDLAADIAEKRDLLPSRSADVQRLRNVLADWEREVRPAR